MNISPPFKIYSILRRLLHHPHLPLCWNNQRLHWSHPNLYTMARPRKKKRTHKGLISENSTAKSSSAASSHDPKSMVIRMGAGEIGPSISQLAKDLRMMLEPGTATRLKERRSNKLRDYTTMSGPLGVSHLLLLSRSEIGHTNLRIALCPRGPTCHFRIQNYSLMKDVLRMQRHSSIRAQDFRSPPLLVMSKFVAPEPTQRIPRHLENLITAAFQSIFPPVKPNQTPLACIRRVVLLSRDHTSSGADGFVINLRQYSISSRALKRPRKFHQITDPTDSKQKAPMQGRKVPRLGNLDDVADLFQDATASFPGYISQSESEWGSDAEVDITPSQSRIDTYNRFDSTKMDLAKLGAASKKTTAERRSIKLTEIGPRLQLKMTKIEDDLCKGKIMWHDHM